MPQVLALAVGQEDASTLAQELINHFARHMERLQITDVSWNYDYLQCDWVSSAVIFHKIMMLFESI